MELRKKLTKNTEFGENKTDFKGPKNVILFKPLLNCH